jgi:hypothetical protein
MNALTFWQRFVQRNKRVLGEVTQLQVDLAKESKRSSPRIVKGGSISKSAIFFFWILLVLAAVLGWSILRSGR